MGAPKGNKFAVGNCGGNGHPSQYKPKYAVQARKACEAGFTDIELAELLGVSEVTINNWKLEHKDFALALRIGKSVADDRMERSLYQRGIGYTFEATKVVTDSSGFEQITRTSQHIPGDVTAQSRWLFNRRPEIWRDKHEVNVAGKVENVFTLNIFEHDLSNGMKVIEQKKAIPRLRSE